MTTADHFRALEKMYAAAPINKIYAPTMIITRGRAEIGIAISARYHHSGGGVHGSVYFKMLDDAAFFAANSLETEFFVLTATFTATFLRPVVGGRMRSVGTVVSEKRTKFTAESVVYDADGMEIGKGKGVFVKSRMKLIEALGYQR